MACSDDDWNVLGIGQTHRCFPISVNPSVYSLIVRNLPFCLSVLTLIRAKSQLKRFFQYNSLTGMFGWMIFCCLHSLPSHFSSPENQKTQESFPNQCSFIQSVNLFCKISHLWLCLQKHCANWSVILYRKEERKILWQCQNLQGRFIYLMILPD